MFVIKRYYLSNSYLFFFCFFFIIVGHVNTCIQYINVNNWKTNGEGYGLSSGRGPLNGQGASHYKVLPPLKNPGYGSAEF